MGDEDAPTGVAPTELTAATPDETDAATAWSLDDGEEWESPRRRFSPGTITAVALAGSVLVVGVAAGIVGYYLHPGEESVNSPETATVTATTAVASPPEPSPRP